MEDAKFSPHTRLVQLEVIPEDEQQVDIADIDRVGRGLFDGLTSDGYVVQPTATGRKGGEPLYDILLQIPQFLQQNKDWLLGSIPPILQCILIIRDQLAKREKTRSTLFKITLDVDGKLVNIETSDPENITNLIKQLQIASPEKVKLQVRVPKKKRHV